MARRDSAETAGLLRGPASTRTGIAVDEFGNLFIAEYGNNRIRRVDANSSVISTVGGYGLPHRPPSAVM
jgi:hypothetical protein